MKLHDFIFSEKLALRLSRHFLFWSFVFVFYFVGWSGVCLNNPANSTTLSFSVLSIVNDLKMANFSPDLIYTAKNLVVLMAYSYIVSYWLLPCYLIKRRYLAFVSWLVVLTLIAEIIRLYYSGFLSLEFVLIWFGVISFVSVGAPIYCGLFITAKMIK